jgi:hypothetical protein
MTVLVSSENTQPSESLPMTRMGTAIAMRPVRRTFWLRHLGNLGKGPRVHPQTMLAKKRVMAREM